MLDMKFLQLLADSMAQCHKYVQNGQTLQAVATEHISLQGWLLKNTHKADDLVSLSIIYTPACQITDEFQHWVNNTVLWSCLFQKQSLYFLSNMFLGILLQFIMKLRF